MNVDNVRSQMRKGMLEYCILLLLHREAAYASDIILKLKEAHLIVVEGTLYPLLHQLEEKNLLTVYGQEFSGKTRKYYSITKEGRKAGWMGKTQAESNQTQTEQTRLHHSQLPAR